MLSHSKLPRAGIGNKLFVWAQGLIFARKNHCRHITTGWIKLHIGPIIRREKSYRFYSTYFKTTQILFDKVTIILSSRITPRQKMKQQDIDIVVKERNLIYEFHEIPHSDNYFIILDKYRDIIKEHIYSTFTNKIYNDLFKHKSPEIGVHIRLGDFKVGNQATPISYYANCINQLRKFYGSDLSATIFSDGTKEELSPLLELHNVTIAPDDKDIIHLLLLSRSRYIILTSNSTFSLWASFLSEAVLIYDKKYIKHKIRPDSTIFEGEINDLA